MIGVGNAQLVTDFIAAWNGRDLDRIVAAMAPDAVYHNIPMEPVMGRAAIRSRLAGVIDSSDSIEWVVLQIAESRDGVVLTERIDDFVRGPKRISVRVMGVFEFRDGLIAAWRDYFDLAEFQRQL